jgi:hypothetical protein
MVPKRRLSAIRRRGNSQKKPYYKINTIYFIIVYSPGMLTNWKLFYCITYLITALREAPNRFERQNEAFLQIQIITSI